MYLNVHEPDPAIRQTFQAYALNRIHEKATTNLFERVVKPGDTVLDLGANIGYFTLLAAKLVGETGKVFSFEPEPRNYKYLVENLRLNNYEQVSAFQKAVSNQKGRTKLYICLYDTGHHTINQYQGIKAYRPNVPEDKEEFIEIETVSLDEFFEGRENEIDVIKMDVEGAEMLALLGMDQLLRANRKIKMFVEFFPLLIKKMGNSPEEFILKLLKDYQFKIFVVPDDYDSSDKEFREVKNPYEIMNFCQGKEDHVNLFLKRE